MRNRSSRVTLTSMNTAGKSIIAFLYALAVVLIPFIDGRHTPTPTEWVQIAIAAATAVSVYLTPLIPQAPWAKTAVGATLAGLQVLVALIGNGVNGNDLLLITVAVDGTFGSSLSPANSINKTAVPWGASPRVHR